jgi:hypothetical protein
MILVYSCSSDIKLIVLLAGHESDFASLCTFTEDAAKILCNKKTSDLLLNLGFYKRYQELLYPDKPLVMLLDLKMNDQEFANCTKIPKPIIRLLICTCLNLGLKPGQSIYKKTV